MSRGSSGRVAWTCPECERTYRIPQSLPRPERCANCEARQKRDTDDGDIEFAAAPAEPAPRAAFVREPLAAAVNAGTSSCSTIDAGAATESALPTREQFDEMIAHLESINRTMKLFRRFLWAIGIVALLNVLLVGASLLYGMSMLSSLFSGGGGAGANGAGASLQLGDQRALDALPPEAKKAIEDYLGAMDDALQDAR